MMKSFLHFLDTYPIVSDQIKRPALEVVLGGLEQALDKGVEGDIVEFGCYVGTTSLFVRRVLDARDESDKRAFYVYDSFEGLPEKASQDTSAAGIYFKEGELAVSKKQFLHEFHKANLKPPITHKVWFNEVADRQLPEKIAFAFLDGDFYESIRDSLKLVWPRLAEGGIIAVDDYKRETLPGVERAVSEFMTGKAIKLTYSHNIALLKR
jgi:O-methyltransferase